ncbi:hypothetical protein NGM33_28740 [Nocardiopsis dassonvillei]|uniref:hypothetical protein n=1 Tax=Nocardiopsis dassonvillei TaxID=2014 RepID=UPI0020A310B2|nr:hypothetical protein [Nocardiopsis dassonvillei]MCP3017325.1 hypothetical protein [Nocardiopsis dassonvillei]
MISTEGTEYTITYAVAPYAGESTEVDYHRFQAITDDGTVASELHVAMDTLIIANIETAPTFRREGIATALFEAAEKQLPAVLHARPAHRTEEGNGWADAVGGDTEDHDTDEDEDPWN